jgi:hypothetical protein
MPNDGEGWEGEREVGDERRMENGSLS